MSLDFSRNKILILGDLILDHYRFLDAERLSPEAPIVIFAQRSSQWRFGGAANVANNLKAMGVNDVKLFTVVGDDFDDYKGNPAFIADLHESHFNGKVMSFIDFIACRGRRTTVKERFIARSQQVMRVDSQSRDSIPSSLFEEMIHRAMKSLDGTTAVVVSDYAHGVMRQNDYLSGFLIECREKGIHVVVDTKSRDAIRMYRGAGIIVPNEKEARMMCGVEEKATLEDDAFIASNLRELMDLDAAAVTLGPRGAVMSTRRWNRVFPALDGADEEVVDVTGAGDTLAATMAASLGAGMPYDQAMRAAQAASGVVVQKLGVATATRREMEKALDRYGGPRDVQEGRRFGEEPGEAGGVRGGEGEAREGAPSG